jgi:hypothetical protein
LKEHVELYSERFGRIFYAVMLVAAVAGFLLK